MNTQIKGNLSLTRNADFGGNLTTCGNATVKGRLVVEGWLDAPHVKTPCKGLFADKETLQRAYPNPRVGLWALVGNSIPAQVFIATREGWEATGEMGGTTEVDLNYYDEKIDEVNDHIASVEEAMESLSHPVATKYTATADLIIADEQEHPIATFANGHIRTANFDSSQGGVHPVTTKKIEGADLVIADEREQPILTVTGGHIRTASFNSANITGTGAEINSGGAPAILRVMSINMGHFAWGTSIYPTVTAATYDEQRAMWMKMFDRYTPDVIAMQEFHPTFCPALSMTTKAALLSDYKVSPLSPENPGAWGCNAVASLLKQSDRYEGPPAEGIDGIIAECTITIGTRKIILCSAHASWRSASDNAEYFRAILERYADAPYVIIGSDTNAFRAHIAQLKTRFRQAGYQMANWGVFGMIPTYYGEPGEQVQGIDNIFIKGGTILHAESYCEVPVADGVYADPENPLDTGLENWRAVNPTDHMAIVADVLFR